MFLLYEICLYYTNIVNYNDDYYLEFLNIWMSR